MSRGLVLYTDCPSHVREPLLIAKRSAAARFWYDLGLWEPRHRCFPKGDRVRVARRVNSGARSEDRAGVNLSGWARLPRTRGGSCSGPCDALKHIGTPRNALPSRGRPDRPRVAEHDTRQSMTLRMPSRVALDLLANSLPFGRGSGGQCDAPFHAAAQAARGADCSLRARFRGAGPSRRD